MEIKGRFIKSCEIERGTSKAGKDWARQTFEIETLDQYPKKVAITLPSQSMIDKFDAISPKIGQELTIKFNLDSREYQGKYYTTVIAWSI